MQVIGICKIHREIEIGQNSHDQRGKVRRKYAKDARGIKGKGT